jgi:hypothetical protein
MYKDVDHYHSERLSCCGQNKNFFIICLWQYLVRSGRFKLIDHKFPESGHSFMDSDRDFGHIEKKVREIGNIYSIDQYQDIMAQSQVKTKPHITRMQGNLYDIKALPGSLGLTHRKITTDGEPVRFRDGVKWIRVEEFGSYKFKESLDEEAEWKTVDLMKAGNAVTEHTLSISDYCTKLSGHIKKAKKDDIKKQMEYIPDIYKEFYLNLAATNDEGDCNSSRELGDEELEDPRASSGQNKKAEKAARGKKMKGSVIRGSSPGPNSHVAQNVHNAQVNVEQDKKREDKSYLKEWPMESPTLQHQLC